MHFGSPSDPSQTAAAEAKPRCVYSILKPHGQSFRRQVRLLLSKAKLSDEYLISKPHGQSAESPVRPMSREARYHSFAASDAMIMNSRSFESPKPCPHTVST